jgi:hypothetical protein
VGSGYASLTIEDNTFQNLAIGCYGDSWKCGSVYIKNNWFNNCQRGIAAEMTIEQYAQIEDLIVQDNVFDAYGGVSGLGPEDNFIGGWCLRVSQRINRLIFERNRVFPLDDKLINEGTPFCGEVLNMIIRENMFHSQVGRSNPTLSQGVCIDEGNVDQWGIARWVQPWNLPALKTSGQAGQQVRFTASAATNSINTNVTQFREGDFVYFFSLTGGAGLATDTKYYVRDLVTNALTKVQTFNVYTTATGGSPVDITADYTSQSRISNRECRNGKDLESAINTLKSMIFLTQDPNYGGRPQTAELQLYPGVYEPDTVTGAPIVGNFPEQTKIVGIGKNEDIVIRLYGGVAIDISYGNGSNNVFENLNLFAWGPNSAFMSPNGAPGNNRFINCVFSMGAGATRAVGGGSSGLGTANIFINCTSTAPLYDPALNQGNAVSCQFIECTFSGGIPPSCTGAIFKRCTMSLPIGVNIAGGSIEDCKFTSLNLSSALPVAISDGIIRNSTLNGFYVQIAGTSNKIHNTVVDTNFGTNSFFAVSTPTVEMHNVACDRILDSDITVTGLTQINGTMMLSGSGTPSAAAPNGSMYLRTDGGGSTTLYVRAAGAWEPLASY